MSHLAGARSSIAARVWRGPSRVLAACTAASIVAVALLLRCGIVAPRVRGGGVLGGLGWQRLLSLLARCRAQVVGSRL